MQFIFEELDHIIDKINNYQKELLGATHLTPEGIAENITRLSRAKNVIASAANEISDEDGIGILKTIKTKNF